uniref:Transposase n=1 Tax=Globodera rostochiensis TaxID=31243 RepID=A0A914IEE2_GLORO
MPVPSSTKCYSDKQKREIVHECIALKNKFLQEKKHSHNEWNQFYANFFKEYGVGHSTIFKWQKQFAANNNTGSMDGAGTQQNNAVEQQSEKIPAEQTVDAQLN